MQQKHPVVSLLLLAGMVGLLACAGHCNAQGRGLFTTPVNVAPTAHISVDDACGTAAAVNSQFCDPTQQGCVVASCSTDCRRNDSSVTMVSLLPDDGAEFEFESGSSALSMSEPSSLSSDRVGVAFSIWFRTVAETGCLLSKEGELSLCMVENGTLSILVAGANTALFVSFMADNQWQHVAVSVHVHTGYVFVNGEHVASVALTTAYSASMHPTVLGGEGIRGWLAAAVLADKALMPDDATFLFRLGSGEQPMLPTDTCRCPPSHPFINPSDETECLDEPAPSASSSSVFRWVSNSFPLSNMVDADASSFWIGSLDALERPTTLPFDLLGKHEFYGITLSFTGPRPAAMVIERSPDNGQTWEAYHYLSNGCMGDFGMPAKTEDDLESTTDVICVANMPGSGDVTYQLLLPLSQPETFFGEAGRLLREFSQATHIRVILMRPGQSLVSPANAVTDFFATGYVVITARPDCNGHADTASCPSTLTPMQGMLQCCCRYNTHWAAVSALRTVLSRPAV